MLIKLSGLINSILRKAYLKIEEKTALNLTTNDRKRRYIIYMGKYQYKTITIKDLKLLNRMLRKNWSVYDLLFMSDSIIEFDPHKEKSVRFGKENRN